jgi:outer membrane receptor protein involved in Fe transport
MYHDLSASFRFDATPALLHRLFAGAEIRLGIQNLLDESPPILAETSTSSSGYSTYGDARLRRYSISIRKIF